MCMLTRVQEVCSEILIQVNVLANARSSTPTYSEQLIILRLRVQHFFFQDVFICSSPQEVTNYTGLSQDGEGMTRPTLPLIG